jgi:hypothetical protein
MKRLFTLLSVLCLSLTALAKDAPIVVPWPSPEKPMVRFTFGKFAKLGGAANLSSYNVEVIAENLSGKPISLATFDAYFFTRENIRNGSGYIALNNIGATETVRFTMTVQVTGPAPVSLKLAATHVPKEWGPAAPPRTVRLTVYSVPPGASVSLDGEPQGTTPKQVELTSGKHIFTFSMAGYKQGNYPIDIGPSDVSGGSITYELGGLAHDTVELRDGTTVNGDVESVDAAQVHVRIGGVIQDLDRNQVKRILLVERETPPALPAAQ